MKGCEGMEKSQQKAVEMEHVVKIEEWALLILLAIIPIINMIFLSYLSFKRENNLNKKNFARAALIYVVIMYALIIITMWLRYS